MKKTTLLKLTPIIIIGIMELFSWGKILFYAGTVSLKDYIGLIAFVLTAVTYFWKSEVGIILTGLILLFASFCLFNFLPTTVKYSFYFRVSGRELETPSVNLIILPILILYLILNWQLFRKKEQQYESDNNQTH